jgi:Nucleotide-diphospho-sugar transferase
MLGVCQIHKRCFALLTEGVDFSEQEDFLSDGYLKMMWRRINFLRVDLEKGYSFIFFGNVSVFTYI